MKSLLDVLKRRRKKKVLIVDDDISLCKVLEALFETKGYEVLLAANGDEGLEKVKMSRPDVIVLDVLMPGKSGLDVASQLKDDPEYKSIPIVMLTAIDRKTGKSEHYWRQRSRADVYIAKPFEYSKLLQVVEEVLGNVAASG